MAYNFGIQNLTGFDKAKQWLKNGYGVLSGGKPPVDDAADNNYQSYADNVLGTGAIAAFKAVNASNQFEINNGHAVIDNSVTINAVAVPATPTAAVSGTAGATTYTYKVVGRAGNLQAPSATVSVTTGNATLSATNFVGLTFVPTPGFLTYDVYRTVGGSTTGMIGTVAAALGQNVSAPTLTFSDTGLTADGSTAPSVNTTAAVVGDLNIFGNLALNPLATPHAPLVTPHGTAGASTWGYKIVARCGSFTTPTGHTAASAAGTTTTGNSTLTSVNSNLLAWQPVPGALTYDVYRTAAATAPTTTGLIGSTTGRTFTDTGLAGDSSTAPVSNTTGVSAVLTSTSPGLASIVDTNGNPEIIFTATASAVNGLTETNSATGNPVALGTSGSDTNIGFTLNSKGTGAVTVAPGAAGGTIVIGKSDQTGAITVGSSSGTDVVNVGTGAGVSTINLATVSVAGANLNVATAATGAGITDTVAISTGNAAATGVKVVNILTGTPGTSGNNKLTMGGGAASAVTMNAVIRSYQAVNYQGTESGANNALVAALLDAGGNAVTVAAGLIIWLKLGHSLQAGANTLNLNSHGADAIKKTSNPATDLSVTAVSGSILMLIFDGTVWQVQGQ